MDGKGQAVPLARCMKSRQRYRMRQRPRTPKTQSECMTRIDIHSASITDPQIVRTSNIEESIWPPFLRPSHIIRLILSRVIACLLRADIAISRASPGKRSSVPPKPLGKRRYAANSDSPSFSQAKNSASNSVMQIHESCRKDRSRFRKPFSDKPSLTFELFGLL